MYNVGVLSFGIFFQDDVLGLYVPMQVAQAVEELKPFDDFRHDFRCLFELEDLIGLFGLIVQEVTSIAVFANEIQILFVFLEAE